MRLRPLVSALLALGLAAPAWSADLLEAYELARQGDPQLAAAEARAAAARAGVDRARAALLPQVAATASLTDSDGDSTSFGSRPDGSGGVVFDRNSSSQDSRNRTYGINLTQSVYDHANYTRLKAARAAAAEAEAQRLAAEQALAVRVATAYFNTLTSIEALASARAQEAAAKRQLDQAETRLEVGLAPITDVHEARASYDGARANAIAAATRLDDAREALAEITGRPLAGLRGLAPDYQPTLADTEGLEAWVQRALEGNPGLQAAALALEGAEANVATARAGHLPTLSLSAGRNDSATWGNNTVGGITFPNDAASDGNRVGLTLTVPIFAGGAVQAGVRQALASRDATAEQLEQQRRSIARQTRNAYRSLAAGAAEVEARRLAVVSAKAALEAGEAGLEVGTRTVVDVLLAQQTLFAAQTQFAQARHNFLVNELSLKQAAGSLSVEDIRAVNRLLVADAEALLDATK
ncbi:MAG: membrane protein [Silanimonas sp.]|nr:MAG: membrane protein [Silanimonas sp.]